MIRKKHRIKSIPLKSFWYEFDDYQDFLQFKRLKKKLIKILEDIINLVFFSLTKKEKFFSVKICILTLEYLKPIMKQLGKNKKLFIISYVKINLDKKNFNEIYLIIIFF